MRYIKRIYHARPVPPRHRGSHAARRSPSIARSQPAIRFQLLKSGSPPVVLALSATPAIRRTIPNLISNRPTFSGHTASVATETNQVEREFGSPREQAVATVPIVSAGSRPLSPDHSHLSWRTCRRAPEPPANDHGRQHDGEPSAARILSVFRPQSSASGNPHCPFARTAIRPPGSSPAADFRSQNDDAVPGFGIEHGGGVDRRIVVSVMADDEAAGVVTG